MTRVAMILPGLGRVQRGAETAFIQVARRLAEHPDMHVEAFGSGHSGPKGVIFHHVPCISRRWFQRWPKVPCLRNECYYEELTFVAALRATRRFRPKQFDVTIVCTYPYINWRLQRISRRGGPRQVFVTQNGDWMCQAKNREYRYFQCDGLVCINPEYYQRHKDRYHAALIPNGVDPVVFYPASEENLSQAENPPELAAIPRDRNIVLMVSAMIESKRVAEGVRAVAEVPDAYLVVAGDGPEQQNVAELAAEYLTHRHLLLGSIPAERMPALFRRANAFLHMSHIEPFGIVYLEAAASGLPVVAPDLDVPRWILGDTALFADPHDLGSVSEMLQAALTVEVGGQLGEQARRRVLADWTWQAQGDKYREFILELLDKPTKRPTEPESQKETGDDLDRDRQLQHA